MSFLTHNKWATGIIGAWLRSVVINCLQINLGSASPIHHVSGILHDFSKFFFPSRVSLAWAICLKITLCIRMKIFCIYVHKISKTYVLYSTSWIHSRIPSQTEQLAAPLSYLMIFNMWSSSITIPITCIMIRRELKSACWGHLRILLAHRTRQVIIRRILPNNWSTVTATHSITRIRPDRFLFITLIHKLMQKILHSIPDGALILIIIFL